MTLVTEAGKRWRRPPRHGGPGRSWHRPRWRNRRAHSRHSGGARLGGGSRQCRGQDRDRCRKPCRQTDGRAVSNRPAGAVDRRHYATPELTCTRSGAFWHPVRCRPLPGRLPHTGFHGPAALKGPPATRHHTRRYAAVLGTATTGTRWPLTITVSVWGCQEVKRRFAGRRRSQGGLAPPKDDGAAQKR